MFALPLVPVVGAVNRLRELPKPAEQILGSCGESVMLNSVSAVTE